MLIEPSSPSDGGFVAFGGVSVDLIQIRGTDLIPGAEAARIAGVTEGAIRQWATRGKIHRFPGRRRCEGTMYARPEVEAVAAEQRAKNKAGPLAAAA